MFLFCTGQSVLAVVEQTVPSGVAALAMTAIPLWLVLLDALRPGGTRPSQRVSLGLLLGVAGIALLAGRGAAAASPGSILLLVGSALSWAIGSLYSRHAPRAPSAPVHTGAQLLTAGAILLVVSTLRGDHALPALLNAPRSVLLAFTFLVLGGSVITFSAYTWLLQVSSPAKVGTYAFVNPLVAVLLGSVVLGEAFTPRLLLALVVVLGGVGLVITAPKPATPQLIPTLLPPEPVPPATPSSLRPDPATVA